MTSIFASKEPKSFPARLVLSVLCDRACGTMEELVGFLLFMEGGDNRRMQGTNDERLAVFHDARASLILQFPSLTEVAQPKIFRKPARDMDAWVARVLAETQTTESVVVLPSLASMPVTS